MIPFRRSHRTHVRRKRPQWPRLAALLAVLLLLLFGGLHAIQQDILGRVQLELADVRDLPQFTADDRILVLAPHPDDEVLSTGGVIQAAIQANASIHVVFMTFGDSNIVSFQTYQFRPIVTAAQVRAMGELRGREALESLAILGVPGDSVRFLGYPDAGALDIWKNHWQEAQPFRGRFTRSSNVPYAEAVTTGAEYRGESILADLEESIKSFSPTAIFVSHPDDTNPDHQALWLFAQTALNGLGPPYDSIPLWASLVHYGEWPQPGGYRPNQYLLPPENLVGQGVEWAKLILTEEQLAVKRSALGAHRTQLSFRRGYLESFLRQNELFGIVVPAHLVEPDSVEAASYVRLSHSPQMSLLRAVAPGLYLDSLEARLEDADLVVRLTTQRPLSPRESITLWVVYQEMARPFAETPKLAITLGRGGLVSARDRGRDVSGNVSCIRDGSGLEVRLGLTALGYPDRFYVQAQMRVLNVVLEATGWRMANLRQPFAPVKNATDLVANSAMPAQEELLEDAGDPALPAR